MSSVDDVIDDVLDDDAYYDPDEKIIIPEGSYPAHIISFYVSKEKPTRYGNPYNIYKPVYRIDESVDIYGGMSVSDKGIFRFRGKNNNPSKKSNSKGNLPYKTMLDKLEIPLNKVVVNGKEVYRLPSVDESQVYGKPVIINVYHDTFKGSYGVQKVAVANIAHAWKDGKPLDGSPQF
ncbi:hypothetical protein CMI47_16575 [Candidatus Pacearchaeota archaeon]|jgi:hypothetical protein|nr:hypothetical protein [Candidatus Pacearchaeota archaeon]|tara:strand:- start:2871 stop:3401 length:531 start_codon:yes stop_codon:yes gene_type:complete